MKKLKSLIVPFLIACVLILILFTFVLEKRPCAKNITYGKHIITDHCKKFPTTCQGVFYKPSAGCAPSQDESYHQ